jgi:hypothetical protein
VGWAHGLHQFGNKRVHQWRDTDYNLDRNPRLLVRWRGPGPIVGVPRRRVFTRRTRFLPRNRFLTATGLGQNNIRESGRPFHRQAALLEKGGDAPLAVGAGIEPARKLLEQGVVDRQQIGVRQGVEHGCDSRMMREHTCSKAQRRQVLYYEIKNPRSKLRGIGGSRSE